MGERTCSVDGCNRQAHARGWCKRHYLRWSRHGDPTHGAGLRERPPADGRCAIPGCVRRHKARGYCETHYARLRIHGDPAYVGTPAGEDHYKWSGADASYVAVHYRIKKIRGPASAHSCAHCGDRALQWAYDHQDADERTGEDHGRVMVYSLDLAHYIPLCASCHKRFDLANGPAVRSGGR